MQRTKYQQKFKLPDAINCSNQNNFTQIPNTLLRDPNISAKAKTILCILLSNKSGWRSYNTTLLKMLKEGKDALQSGLQELEKNNYLLRIRYRCKKTKEFKGSFWAYTDLPDEFKIEEHVIYLEELGFEIESTKKPEPDYPDMANPDMANPHLIRVNNKNNKQEKNIIPPPIKLIIEYCQERNSSVNPNTFHNWNTSKGWMIGKNKMKDWQAAIRTWEIKDKQQTGKSINKSGSRAFGNKKTNYVEYDEIITNE